MNTPNVSALEEASMGYARIGWPVFPCHPTGHQPLDGSRDAQGRSGFYLATTDERQIGRWWSRWPDAAIGLRTGQASGVFALDIDPRNGGDGFLEELEATHGSLPPTVESQTGGGGRHILFQHPGHHAPCSTGAIAAGIDVKGDGGYIILPPSDHESGNAYHWLIGHEPGECPVAPAPDWLLELIDRTGGSSSSVALSSSSSPSPPETKDDDAIPEGNRNKTLASLAGHMRQVGMGLDAIHAALIATNTGRCRPPLDEGEVGRIARSVSRYDPDTVRQAGVEGWADRYLAQNQPADGYGPVLTCLADVTPRDVRWLWPQRIAIGKITMLAGDPGLGKSFCSLDIAARVSAGLPWPDLPGETREPGGVIVLTAEDALDDTVRPRLDAAGADPSRIVAIEAIQEFDLTGKPKRRGFHLDRDLDSLAGALGRVRECRLIVIDPISAYLGEANSHNNAEVRALLSPLSDLAARHRVAVLAISHLNKGHGDAMYRVMGSLAFIAAARAGYVVVKDARDAEGQRRLVLPIKNNLGDDASGLAYRIIETPGRDQPRIEWEPDVVRTTLEEAMGLGSSGVRSPEAFDEAQRKRTQVAEAVEWLTSYLGSEGKPVDEIITAARADGISRRTLERAKSQAGVVAMREGFGEEGRWVWRRVDIQPLVERCEGRPP